MIYLDSAATTLQKPASVSRAVGYAVNHLASPGRGGHAPAMRAADTAFACREAAAELFHVKEPDNVVFTMNATHALNIAIKSIVKPGDTVVISGYEHNAVTRPLAAIPDLDVKIAASDLFDPEDILRAFREMVTGDVSCVICNHVSNVFGYVLPVTEISALCARRGVPFILDASQSAGTLPVYMDQLQAAFVAMPGHKGLYGPQGTGLLLCGHETTPILEGGTGSLSAVQEMPDFLPDRLEAGTHNVTGIAGLLEGIRFVQSRTPEGILNHERLLTAQAAERLSAIPGVEVYAAPRLFCQAGVLSFRVRGMDCEEVGERLGEQGIAVRAGLHCAPLAHRSAGTFDTGTVRCSLSAFNTRREVEQFSDAVARLERK